MLKSDLVTSQPKRYWNDDIIEVGQRLLENKYNAWVDYEEARTNHIEQLSAVSFLSFCAFPSD